MKSLHKMAASVNGELGKIQDAVITDRLRWMDVEVAMASENGPHDNMIIDGFKGVDKQMGSYPENDWGPSSMSTDRKLSSAGLDGKEVTSEDIKKKALDFLGHQARGTDVKIKEEGSKTDLPVYNVSVKGQGGVNIQIDYTRKGGYLLWFMNPRNVTNRKLNFDTARNKGSQFLIRHDYKDMTPITYDEYDHVAVFTYVHSIDGVKIYPDKVTVRVALDNGEVVGVQASDHVFFAKKLLTPGKPKITKEKAKEGLNPDFKVEDYSLAVIENEMREPTLCHEFVGKIHDHHYRIFMNADTGLEESIEEIPDSAKAIYK